MSPRPDESRVHRPDTPRGDVIDESHVAIVDPDTLEVVDIIIVA